MRRSLLLILVVLIMFFPTEAQAINESNELAVVLVVDNSGSMTTSDPQRLHQTATEIFIDLLSPQDQVSVVTFADEALTIVPLQAVGDSAVKRQIKQTVRSALQKRGDTDYLKAFQAAQTQLSAVSAGESKKIVLFLTDGKPDRPEWVNTPGAQDIYMQDLWKQAEAMANSGIMIHSVGFSEGLDDTVLQKLAEMTQGTANIIDQPAELIQRFFETLRILKNRTLLQDETLQVSGAHAMNLSMDKAVAQTRYVLVHPARADIQLSTADSSGQAVIDRYPDYDILTIEGGGSGRDIPFEIRGTGTVRLIADQDPLVKIELLQPTVNSVLPLGEALHVKAGLKAYAQDLTRDLQLKAALYEGETQISEVQLTPQDDQFLGTLPAIEKRGNYRLDVKAMLGDTEMSHTEATYYLRQLPLIRLDSALDGQQYKQGQQVNIQAGLQLNGLPVKQGQNVEVLAFSLKNAATEQPFTDDGKGPDLKAEDGIWSTVLSMEHPGENALHIGVQGSIDGIPFTLNKSIGSVHVHSAGQFELSLEQSIYTLYPNQVTPVTLHVVNHSELDERLLLSLQPQDQILLQQQFIDVKAGESKAFELGLKLANDSVEGVIPVTIVFFTEQGGQRSLIGELALQTEISSFFKSVAKNVRTTLRLLKLPLILAAAVATIVFAGEALLRKVNLRRSRIISGQLSYQLPGHDERAMLCFDDHTKTSCTVAFGRGKKADLVIDQVEAPYILRLRKELTSAGRQRLWGWKRLFRGADTVAKLYAEVDFPGIISTGNQAHAKLFLTHDQPFRVAGVDFIYEVNRTRPGTGRDVLEGRDI